MELLLVEDNSRISEFIVKGLEESGFFRYSGGKRHTGPEACPGEGMGLDTSGYYVA